MNTPDDSQLREAVAAHNVGRLTEAEVGYRRVLRKHPSDPGALYGLGLLCFHQGLHDVALQYVSKSLVYAPENGRAWNTLGSMFMSSGRHEEAQEAYSRATNVTPKLSEAWYNLGICHRHDGDLDRAVPCLRKAAACDPPYILAYEALGALLYQIGRIDEAAEVYRRWVSRDPTNHKARHMAAAAAGEDAPARASDEYVRQHFDVAAASFDKNLTQLDYRAPGLVATALADAVCGATDRLHSVLDAGCGTGLCGALIRKLCGRLVGVDLSPNMLERALERGGYDELIAMELTGYMLAKTDTFDAIVCADTFVYFGALAEPFRAAFRSLHAAGFLIFTVEALDDKVGSGQRLGTSGRYAHTQTYVRAALSAAGFQLESLTQEVLRQERSEAVAGLLVVARK